MRHRETGIKAANKLSLLHLSLSLYQLSLRLWGITTPEKTTNRGYDLHSRGPPTLDAQALDNQVSRVRRSSSSRSHTSGQSLNVTQPPPSPPPSPPSTSSIMTTKTIDNLATIIKKLVGTISVLQNDVESLKKDALLLAVRQRRPRRPAPHRSATKVPKNRLPAFRRQVRPHALLQSL
jgi:FtsZ-binding cell division protein ZapB